MQIQLCQFDVSCEPISYLQQYFPYVQYVSIFSDKWIHFSNTITKAIRMPKVKCRFMIFSFFCKKSFFFFCRSLIKITFNCRGNVVKEQIAKKGAIWRNFFHATMVAKIKSSYFRISESQCGNFGILLTLTKKSWKQQTV